MGSNQTKIDPNVYESIAKYTQLKREDILAWQERFNQNCNSGSMTMNKEQFCKFYQELRPNENVKHLSENVFRAFDLNGDQGITFSRGLSISRKLFLQIFSLLFSFSLLISRQPKHH